MIKLSVIETTWGWLGIAGTQRGICGLSLPKPQALAALAEIEHDFPDGEAGTFASMDNAAAELHRYFAGERVVFGVPLDLPERPPFWSRVWRVATTIRYGTTKSYGAVAAEAGQPRASRAVGGAMAHNPVPIIVPCHRVIGSQGGLTGFGGGLTMKRRLLQLEQATEAKPLQPN